MMAADVASCDSFAIAVNDLLDLGGQEASELNVPAVSDDGGRGEASSLEVLEKFGILRQGDVDNLMGYTGADELPANEATGLAVWLGIENYRDGCSFSKSTSAALASDPRENKSGPVGPPVHGWLRTTMEMIGTSRAVA